MPSCIRPIGGRRAPSLREEIQQFVKTRLAAHEYPREVEFLEELPLTATGKIIRKDLRKMEVERKARETRDR